jgi:hypothetical protein
VEKAAVTVQGVFAKESNKDFVFAQEYQKFF